MRRATITIPEELDEALERYRNGFDARPALTAVVQAALASFLRTDPRRALRSSLHTGATSADEIAEPPKPYDAHDLDEETTTALRQRAQLEGRSEIELIQVAVKTYLDQAAHPQPLGIGRYHSGRSDVSTRAEELLRQASRSRS